MSTPLSDGVQRLSTEITGHVQGVGFRAFARDAALRLGLTGFVRNENDGSVTVVAEGERDKLDALLAELRSGPEQADVASVAVEWSEPHHEFYAFRAVH